MKNLKIICDSLSDIPKELIEKYDIEVVPLTVILDGKEYKDGIDISNDDFYKILREENAYPKTSQATYAQFKEVFDKYVNEERKILYIAGSSAATGTYQSAVMAKNDTEGEIYTYDSQTLTYLVGLLVVKAAQMAKEGKEIEEIISEIDKLREKTYVLFSVDTLEYLQKGGRISSTKAAIGSILNIKPILDIKNGLVAPVCQVRGKKNVISKMVEIIKENCGTDFSDQTMYIAYSDDFKERDRLTEAIKEQFNPKSIEYFQIGTVIGSHAGPGLTGIVCFKK
ncbi:DegV family protein [Clostridium sp. CCUG 7971]|uniref:DegV family protein n=1 Tax=Clostridium sp. CCUG 7971 TaxID=2811414 RepID=UPI001ABBAFEA|nr:DegV family protein [Clostridium sp. CCUG 7971]MBO3444383.1 DegV family protein [Clostridium sp. CCUG 7971]